MPHQRDYAKRLLRELDLPKDAEQVLERRSYWDETFCKLFFELCEELLDRKPQEGLQLALVAPRLARAVPEESGRGGVRKHRELLVRAHSMLGGAFRRVGHFSRADAEHQTAYRISRRGVSKAVAAQQAWRHAYLRTAQLRFGEALKLAEKAVAQSDSPNTLAAALSARGYVYLEMGRYSEGVREYGKALSVIEPKDRLSKRVHYGATHNLSFAVSQNPSPEALSEALAYVRHARSLIRVHRRSLAKYQLYWIEGKILIKLGLGRRGEALLKKAQAGFTKLDVPFEIALVGLDLSELYRDEGRCDELAELAAETYLRFEALSADAEAITALVLWRDAAQPKKLEDQLLSEVKAKLTERMRFQPPRRR